MYACSNIENSQQKMFLSKITIYVKKHNSTQLNSIVNPHSCFVIKTHNFHWIIYQTHNVFSHLLPLSLYAYNSHIII